MGQGDRAPAARLRAVPAPPPPPPPPALPTGTVTFLFTDIEGSTRRWEQHPAAMQQALAHTTPCCAPRLGAHEGVIFQDSGDGFARRLRAGAPGRWPPPWPPSGPCRRRAVARAAGPAAGAHGPAHRRRRVRPTADYAGPPLNRVARLLAAAHGGQILLSGVTRELVAEHLPPEGTLRDLGERRLNDLSEPLRVFQLVAPDLPADFPPLQTLDAAAHQPARASSPRFIGRERELAAVAALAAARAACGW